ncbi:MAG: cobalt-precorrin-5B (C(1))-methyltransferase CbiD [Candidatus Scalinduaceae bacterium]
MKHKYGFTTGSCAAGAAKGAAYGLLQGTIPDSVDINTPANVTLRLSLIHRKVGNNFAECAIRKYSGDDPDITNGCEVHVRIERSENKGIRFMGGGGVGVVTRPGLQVVQGEPAINPVPRSMIKDALKEALGDNNEINGFAQYQVENHPFSPPLQGGDKGDVIKSNRIPLDIEQLRIDVTVTVPEGKKLAKKTFNERLGIIGGISIIGTTGIVRPMSLDSFKVSLLCGLDVAKASGYKTVVLVPGSIGEKGFLKHFYVSKYQVIQMSNFVGFMLNEALKRGFKRIILAGHPGKLAKLIRGDFYTHSSESKPANDILITIFKKERISSELINEIDSSSTVEGMVEILRENDKLHIFDCIADMIQSSANKFVSSKTKIGIILFDMRKNIVGVSKDFKDWQKSF